MTNMNDMPQIYNFSIYRQGAGHKPNKPCQDHARHENSDNMHIVALSDGHGGSKYFRSHFGSEIATDVAVSTLREFMSRVDFNDLLGDSDFIAAPIQNEADTVPENTEYLMRHMFMHICSEWHRRIAEHWEANEITDEESAYLSTEQTGGKPLYDYYFNADGKTIRSHLPSAYGCTLFGVAETTDGLWIAFHIGDGKCVAFNENGTWNEPIPWDERCFQNLTTSLSSYGEESFRYCIGRKAPVAVIVASDGMDDSYAPMSELAFEYGVFLLSNLVFNGNEKTEAKLGDWLDKVSENYSKDDMSLAYIVQPELLKNCLRAFAEDCIVKTEEELLRVTSDNATESEKYAEAKEKFELLTEDIKGIKRKKVEDFDRASEIECHLNDIKAQRERKNRGCKGVLDKFRKIFNIDLDCELQNPNVDQEESVFNSELKKLMDSLFGYECSLSNYRKEEEALARELPVLKKHATEAARRCAIVEQKLGRLNKVMEFLKRLENSDKEEETVREKEPDTEENSDGMNNSEPEENSGWE